MEDGGIWAFCDAKLGFGMCLAVVAILHGLPQVFLFWLAASSVPDTCDNSNFKLWLRAYAIGMACLLTMSCAIAIRVARSPDPRRDLKENMSIPLICAGTAWLFYVIWGWFEYLFASESCDGSGGPKPRQLALIPLVEGAITTIGLFFYAMIFVVRDLMAYFHIGEAEAKGPSWITAEVDSYDAAMNKQLEAATLTQTRMEAVTEFDAGERIQCNTLYLSSYSKEHWQHPKRKCQCNGEMPEIKVGQICGMCGMKIGKNGTVIPQIVAFSLPGELWLPGWPQLSQTHGRANTYCGP